MNHVTTEKTHSADGSVTLSEIGRRERAWADEQPMTVRCAFCRWSNTGPAARARATAERHRLKKHPELIGRAKRTGVDAAVAASRAARIEREDQERLAKVERGRQRELARPVLEEVAQTLTATERPAASSSTRRITPAQQEYIDLLMHGPLTLATIGLSRQTTMQTAYKTLRVLIERGLVVKAGRGLYALPGAAVSKRGQHAEASDGEADPSPVAETTTSAAVLLHEPSPRSETAVELDLTIDTRSALLLMRSDVARLVQTTEWLIEKWQNETGLALEEAA